jgi:histidine triad (HIT) family protein
MAEAPAGGAAEGRRTERRCLFCAIAAGAVPSHRVFEDDSLVAFLDIRPIRPGHVQIVPRAHHAYFDELPPDLAARIVQLGQRLAASLKRIYGVHRVGFVFSGGDIPHVHAHVVPLIAGTDITSRRYIAEETLTFRDMPRAADGELAAIADRLRQGIGGG